MPAYDRAARLHPLCRQLEKRLVGMRDICFAIDSLQRGTAMFARPPAWQSPTVPPESTLSAKSAAELLWLADWIIDAKVRTASPCFFSCLLLGLGTC